MNLYFPTSSLNFNDFFATESVSPKAFYSRRTFGTKRHFTTELSLNDDNSLVWFTSVPLFSLVEKNESEYEEYPIIIELECNPEKEGFIRLSDEVYSINTTIYFNSQNVSFLFISEEEMKKVLIKSKLVDETKLVEKYKHNMSVISKDSLKRIDSNAIQESLDVGGIEIHLFKDKYFNHVKGFLYAWIVKAWLNEYKRNQATSSSYEKYHGLLENLIELSEQLQLETTELLYLTKKYNSSLKKRNYSNDFELFPIDYIENNRVFLKPIGNDNYEHRVFEIIINVILSSPKSKVGEVGHQELLQLVNKVKENIMKKLKGVSSYTIDIDIIQKKLAERFTELGIEDIQSISLKNFMVFILKCNNIEEMDLFLKNQHVDKEYLSYSYLGAFFGFSGLSRKVTYALLDGNNYKLFDRIDRELANLYSQITYISTNDINKSGASLPVNGNRAIEVDASNITHNSFFSKLTTPKNRMVEKHLIESISLIKRARNLPFFLKSSFVLKINDYDEVNVTFEEIGKGIDIAFIRYPESTTYIVHLKHKTNVSDQDRNNFKNKLKKLNLNKSYCQGEYPVFEYKKKIKDQILEVNEDDIEFLYRSSKELMDLKYN